MPKFRHRKVKREHAVLEAIEPGLTLLAESDVVNAIIPGPIRRKRGGATGWSVQYETATGVKFLARSVGAVQEVFVVSPDPKSVIRFAETSGLVPALRTDAAPPQARTSPPAPGKDPGSRH
ncbi:MAG: DUF2103 domain-containing protein [Clostridia bacterium]